MLCLCSQILALTLVKVSRPCCAGAHNYTTKFWSVGKQSHEHSGRRRGSEVGNKRLTSLHADETAPCVESYSIDKTRYEEANDRHGAHEFIVFELCCQVRPENAFLLTSHKAGWQWCGWRCVACVSCARREAPLKVVRMMHSFESDGAAGKQRIHGGFKLLEKLGKYKCYV